jgi:hypothetical protein
MAHRRNNVKNKEAHVKGPKKEHAVVDTPGMQIVAALRCSCNEKEHAVVDTPGVQIAAALRSSCNEKQTEHAVVETDHTKADTPSMQIWAGVGDSTQSKGPDVEEDPLGDPDEEEGAMENQRQVEKAERLVQLYSA